jgi:hypothetical protein
LDYSEYNNYLIEKSQIGGNFGFEPTFMPAKAFPFQKSLIDWSVKKGRGAIFADCGLGKSLCELSYAQNVVEHTNGNVLLLTPLAVGSQMQKEAEKFGIEANRSRDGKVKGKITITNYEQLDKFDPNDFSGLVCDECFPPDTLIDCPSIDGKPTMKYIKDIRRDDKIYNAYGVDNIYEIHKKQIDGAVCISTRRGSFTSSKNHPFFTLRGWRCAQDIQSGDYILETTTAMRMVREDIFGKISGIKNAKILRSILFSELEDESTRDNSKSTHKGNTREDRQEEVGMVQKWIAYSNQRDEKNIRINPIIESGNPFKDFVDIASDEVETFRAWGKWSYNDIATAINEGCTIRKMDTGICYITGPINSRISDELQSRLRKSRIENCYRDRRIQPRIEEGTGSEKGRYAGFVRVDGVEIYEQNDSRLDKYREESGIIYFYDIKATRHPSFSINGCLVHNSSILKNYDAKTKEAITIFARKLKYRLLATATAAPNDFIELGTSSEALGYLGYMDMLSKFFINDQNNCATNRRGRFNEATKWRLKGHAHEHFWQWVSGWARAIRFPSDLGFSDNGYELPELIEHDILLKDLESKPEGYLFSIPANGLKEERDEHRNTITDRCEKASKIAMSDDDFCVIWCNLNDEGDLLEKIIPGSVQVSGKDSDESKEEKLVSFSNGQIKKLIIKPKIGAWGLNWQHCNHTITFPTHSYEQHYQSIRRFWRFGQTRTVTDDMIYTEGDINMIANLKRKKAQAGEMFDKLVQYMHDGMIVNNDKHFDVKTEVPSWL